MSNKTVYCFIFCVRMLVSVVSFSVDNFTHCKYKMRIWWEDPSRRHEKCWNTQFYQKWWFGMKWKLLCAQNRTNQHFTSIHLILFLTSNTKTYGSNAEKLFPNNNNAFMCKFSFHNKAKKISNAKSNEDVEKEEKIDVQKQVII